MDLTSRGAGGDGDEALFFFRPHSGNLRLLLSVRAEQMCRVMCEPRNLLLLTSAASREPAWCYDKRGIRMWLLLVL